MRTASPRYYCPERTVSYGRPAGIRVQQRGVTTPAASPCSPPAPVVKSPTSPSTQAHVTPQAALAQLKKAPKVAQSPVLQPSASPRRQSQPTASVKRVKPPVPPSVKRPQTDSAQRQRQLARSARLLLKLEQRAGVVKKQPKQRLRHAAWRAKAAMKRLSLSPLQAVAMVVVLVSAYVAVDAWLVNQQVRGDLQETVAAAQSVSTSDNPAEARQAAEGKDETPIPQDVVDKYRVAADLPRVVQIDKIGARARVLPMGVNNDGSMQAPLNAFDAGWYTGGVKPGQRGASIIIGHEFGPTRGGLFQKLNTVQSGDIVTVERGDGSVLKYQVVSTKTASLQDIDMNEFIRPANGVDEGLNLMSCTGEWVRGAGTRSHRFMVFTKRIP
ncbi:MAG: sortase [Candidatus Saccharibacteria bacterium]|nr:sortase [Candidatus Saccharibacteria bacterium]